MAEATRAAIEDFPKPTLASIHGYCIGGGAAKDRFLTAPR